MVRHPCSTRPNETSPLANYEPPKRVIISVDDTNKYAPSRGKEEASPILGQTLDTAEQGCSFGIILFSAQRFLSAAH